MTRKILLVDDEDSVLDVIEAILSRGEAVEVRRARDGDEALETANEWKPDLAIVDVLMPTVNGYEVCLALKENPLTRHVKVVMVTGLDQEFDRDKALNEVGADGYLSKPFTATALRNEVLAQLGPQEVPAV